MSTQWWMVTWMTGTLIVWYGLSRLIDWWLEERSLRARRVPPPVKQQIKKW
jgi:hypothetical protein